MRASPEIAAYPPRSSRRFASARGHRSINPTSCWCTITPGLCSTSSRYPTRFRDTVAALGEEALVELVTLLGYYSLISMVLVSFDVPVPDGEAPPFDE